MNGHAVGIGLTLALQCDMRIVVDEGKYGILQVRRGVMPDAYSHWTLPRLMGMEIHHHVMGKPDAADGSMAWLERRAPKWESSVSNDWPDWSD